MSILTYGLKPEIKTRIRDACPFCKSTNIRRMTRQSTNYRCHHCWESFTHPARVEKKERRSKN